MRATLQFVLLDLSSNCVLSENTGYSNSTLWAEQLKGMSIKETSYKTHKLSFSLTFFPLFSGPGKVRKFVARQVQSNDMQSNLAPDAIPARDGTQIRTLARTRVQELAHSSLS